jgi:uncharacterized protein YndB with AHSA1/START domain
MFAREVGGSFRLELAAGPTIHVVTGCVIDLHPSDYLSLSWIHNGNSERPSILQVSFRERNRRGEVQLVHRDIQNRREAAWLMNLWCNALTRLERYFSEATPHARSA